jgi:hypothetical protein
MATTTEMETIRARRVDDEARRMMRAGVTLTWAEAAEIGDEGVDWIRRRLGLESVTDEVGIAFAHRDEG